MRAYLLKETIARVLKNEYLLYQFYQYFLFGGILNELVFFELRIRCENILIMLNDLGY